MLGLDAGANDYLTKPFHSRELLARIRMAIRHSRAMRHNDHIARLKTNPPRITDGKLLRGYLALTPVSPHSRYRASIEI